MKAAEIASPRYTNILRVPVNVSARGHLLTSGVSALLFYALLSGPGVASVYAAGPNPVFQTESFPASVNAGDLFWVTLNVENQGDDFSGNGHITLIVLAENGISATASKSWDGDTDPYLIEVIRTGGHLYVEGNDTFWDGTDWLSAEDHSLSVQLRAPNNRSQIVLYYRTTFCDANWNVIVNNPPSGYTDPVYTNQKCKRKVITVNLPDTTPPSTPGTPYMDAGSETGKSNSDQVTNNDKPLFKWAASTDTGSGVKGYRVSYIDSTPDDDDYWTTTNSWAPGWLDSAIPEGNRTLYVRAVDNAGNWSGVSQTNFTVDKTPPGPPTFVSPGEWATTEDTTPRLDWQDVSGAWKYQAYVREHEFPWLDSRTSPEVTSSEWDVSPALTYKAWGWQVRAWDVAGNAGPYGRNGVADDWGHFTVGDTTPPSTPGTPYMDAGGDSGKSNSDQVTNKDKPLFKWTASTDTGSGVKGYRVSYIDSTPDDDDYWTTTNSWAPGLLDSAIPEGNRTLYVRATDNAGNWSGVSQTNFTVDKTPPGPPTFVSPGEWATTEDTTPRLDWQDVSGAWKYQAYVREHEFPWLDSRTSPEVTSSEWDVSPALTYKAWGWQVRAWDVAGNAGPYGRNGVADDWGHFTVVLARPVITSISPNKASAGTDTGVTISGSNFGASPKTSEFGLFG